MYISKSLWATDELTFTEEDPSSGYYDTHRNWVSGTTTEVVAEGSLQPFKTTNTQRLVLPSGIKDEDARIFYSKVSDLKAAEDFTMQLASTAVVDGRVFFIDQKGDWSRIGTYLKHYAYLLIKKPQNPLTSET